MADPSQLPRYDTRPAQALRVADYLDQHPASTQKEIDAACDTGCISKVISVMPDLGYVLSRGWREVMCMSGIPPRKVRTYTLISRTHAQPDLFINTP